MSAAGGGSVARKVTYVAAMAAVLIAVKEAISVIPNVELVSLMTALFAVYFGKLALFSVYVYVLVEGLLYGFYPWWFIPYLYVWALLWLVCWLLRKNEDTIIWAVVLAVYGLLFGTMCSVPYFVTSGAAVGVAYILSGLGFDLIHAVSNFLLGLLLWKPLCTALGKICPKTETNE